MGIFDSSYNSSFFERNEILNKYFNDIRGFDVLSQEEEKELFDKIRKGDDNARKKIIESNQRFVVSFAKRWATKDNLSDLINEGNIGLIKAIDSFDPSKGNRFLTHAVWYIRSSINNYLVTTDKSIKPVNGHKVYVAASKVKNNFYAKNGRYPTSEELVSLIKEKYNYNLSNEEDVYEIKIMSINNPQHDNEDDLNGNDMYIFNKASSTCNINEYIDNDFTTKTLNGLLDTLPKKHKDIIKMLFGIDELRPLEMEEVAERVGMTRERVRQLKKSIISNLHDKAKKIKSIG